MMTVSLRFDAIELKLATGAAIFTAPAETGEQFDAGFSCPLLLPESHKLNC